MNSASKKDHITALSVSPAFENNIAIGMMCSEGYVKYTSVTLLSIVNTVSKKFNYDILIFHEGLSEIAQEGLLDCVQGIPNISLRFCLIKSTLSLVTSNIGNGYSKLLYYRVFAGHLLPNYSRIICVDSDMIVCADLADLWDVDLHGNYLMAAPEWIYDIPQNYIDQVLHIKTGTRYTFNAGLMILDLEKFRHDFSVEYLLQLCSKEDWKFGDQDVLNILCNRQVEYLQPDWNYRIDWIHYTECHVYISQYEEYLKIEPKVIHFAGEAKPWREKGLPKEDEFWKIATTSPFYSEIEIGQQYDIKPFEPPQPFFEENNIPVFFSSSNYFVPYFATMLLSLIEHISPQYNYDLFVLHTDIKKRNIKILLDMVKGRTNISLRFIDVTSLVNNKDLHESGTVGIASFYRLTVATVFAAYEKILWLDSDMIVNRDVAELYQTDIHDHLLGAVIDATFTGEYCNRRITTDYIDNIMKLKYPLKQFQAGVILFNVPKFKMTFTETELLDFAELHSSGEEKFWNADQDVLNVKCEGDVFFLDPKWNVIFDDCGYRIDAYISYAPIEVFRAYIKSRENPYIIHYAGYGKPWFEPEADFANEFWSIARKSPFYEVILHRMMWNVRNSNPYIPPYYSKVRRWADKVMPKGTRRREFAKKLLPKGTRRWNFCKKIYYFIFKG